MTDAAVAQPRREPAVALWGMALFVAAETTLFAIMLATYFYLRFKNVAWPPRGTPEPATIVPGILLAVLVAATLPMLLAVRAGRSGRLGAVRALLVVALVVQAGYLAFELHEYAADLGRFGPTTSAYASISYTLIGADHAHIALGLLFSVWLLVRLTGGLNRYRLRALTAIALYWIAVTVLTVAVTLTTMSPAL